MSNSDDVGADTKGQRSFLRDAYSVLTGRIAVQIASFLTGIIVARLVGVEGKGLIAAIILAPQMILTIAEFGVRNAAAYHIGKQTWPLEKIVQTTLTTAFLTGIMGILLCLGWIWLTWEDAYTPTMVVLAVLVVPGAIVHTYIGGIFLGMRRIPDFTLSNWGPGVAKLVGTVLFVAILGLGVNGAVGAVTFSVLVVSVVMLRKLSKVVPISIGWNSEIARRMSTIGSSYAIVYFMMVLVYKANIYLVQAFGSIEQLGYYSLGSNLAELLWQIPSVMGALIFSRSASSGDGKEFAKKVAMLSRLTFLMGTVCAIIAWLLAPSVVPWIYGQEFAHSAEILVILLPGCVAMVVFKILRQDLSGRGQPWAATWIIIPMLLATFGVGILVIPEYGAVGAAITMSTVYILGTAGFVVLYARMSDLALVDMVLFRVEDFTKMSNAFSKLFKKMRRPKAKKTGA